MKITQIRIGKAWRRTATFMKLVRHKNANGNLIGEYDQYIYAIIAEFRKTEKEILRAEDQRGGDRKSVGYVKGKRPQVFNSHLYDERLREIIKKVESRYTDN